jgi:hypothetical protein
MWLPTNTLTVLETVVLSNLGLRLQMQLQDIDKRNTPYQSLVKMVTSLRQHTSLRAIGKS